MGNMVHTQRCDTFHVEIRHPGGAWNHIHPPDWETVQDVPVAAAYAGRVQADHPGSAVRIIRTVRTAVTSLLPSPGEVPGILVAGTEVVYGG